MKSIMTFIVVVIVLAAIAFVFYGGYLALVYIWHLFDGLDDTLRLTLLSSFVVFLLGCLIIASALKSAAQTQLNAQLSGAKIGLYKSMVGLYDEYFSVMLADVKNAHQDMQPELKAMNAEFNVVAGGSVIDCYRKLEQSIRGHQSEEKQVANYQQLIKKMRQDLGHTTNLDETRLNFFNQAAENKNASAAHHEVNA